MNLKNQEVTIVKGSDRPINIQLFEEDCDILNVFDLENSIEIKAIFRKDDGTKLELLETLGQVVIVNSSNGLIQVKFEQSQTNSLQSGSCKSFEVEVTTSLDSGVTTDTFVWQFEKILEIKERLL